MASRESTAAGDIAPRFRTSSSAPSRTPAAAAAGGSSPSGPVAGVIVDTNGSRALAFHSAGAIAALAGVCHGSGARRPIGRPAAA